MNNRVQPRGLKVLRSLLLLAVSLLVSAAADADLTVLPGTVISSGETLRAGDGRVALAMQTDGNFVLYHDGRARWASSTV